MQRLDPSPRLRPRASSPPDAGPQITVDEAIASARVDSIADAIATVRVRRRELDRLRVELADAVRDFNHSLAAAHEAGASLRELEEPSNLGKTYIGNIVRDYAHAQAAGAAPTVAIAQRSRARRPGASS